MALQAPTQFYRVQYDTSFTQFDSDGFEAKGRGINSAKLMDHLNWAARPDLPTPFISVFDNFGILYCYTWVWPG
jgi:hypothetical protein